MKINLKLFKEKYRIVSQEPVDIIYDVTLVDEPVKNDHFDELVNEWVQQDDFIWKNEEITFFIYDKEDNEVFVTQERKELLEEVKRLSK